MNAKSSRTVREDTQIAVMANDVSYIKTAVKDLNDKVDNNYVTKEQFAPVQKLVYGLVGLILVAVVGAMMALILRRP